MANGRSTRADECLFLVEKRSCSGHHRKLQENLIETADVRSCINVSGHSDKRFRGQTGKYVLILSLTAFDPSGHSEAFTRLAYRP